MDPGLEHPLSGSSTGEKWPAVTVSVVNLRGFEVKFALHDTHDLFERLGLVELRDLRLMLFPIPSGSPCLVGSTAHALLGNERGVFLSTEHCGWVRRSRHDQPLLKHLFTDGGGEHQW